MKNHIENNGLILQEPPIFYKKGEKKGLFNFATMEFNNSKAIKVNAKTYELYTKH
jgi:hypothetical protein